jgi:uncharacterized delta-60 repeat protein
LTTTHVGVGPAALQALALQPDGRILVAGTAFSNGPTDDDFALVRYLQNGALDPSFSTGGTVTTDFSSGEAGLSSSGSLDRLGGMVLQPDGKIVLAGFTRGDQQAFALARYNPNGRLDISFGVDGRTRLAAVEPQVFAVELQSGGDLVIAGSAGASSRATAPFALIRFHADGSPDQSFGVGGLATTSVDGSRSGARAVVVQPDSKLLAAGARFGAPSAQGDALPQSGFALARYNPDGSIEIAFGSGRDGRALTDMGDAGATPLALVMQPDGKIIAAGLVFFRVPATPPSGAFAVLRHLAGPAAGLALLGVTLALRLVLRPGSRPRPRGQAA